MSPQAKRMLEARSRIAAQANLVVTSNAQRKLENIQSIVKILAGKPNG